MQEQMSVDAESAEQAAYDEAKEAIRTGDVPRLSQLLRRLPGLARTRAQGGRTLLNQVADWPDRWPRRLESAALLIDAGANVNARAGDPNTGETSLQWAVSCYDAALCDLLIEAGAPVNGLNGDRRPMAQALFYESEEPQKVLLRHGALIDLEFAAGLGRMDLLPTFFGDDGALLPTAGTHHPPVNDAEPPANEDAVELLEQALVYASICGRREAAAFLIERGADVNAQPSGFTHRMPILDWGSNHPGIVELLTSAGARRPEPSLGTDADAPSPEAPGAQAAEES